MKTLKFLGLLTLTIISLSSCEKIFEKLFAQGVEPDHTTYWLYIGFQDASGNDLVKGIGLLQGAPSNVPEEQAASGDVKRDLYVFDIILSESCWNFDNENYYTATPHRPGIIPAVNRSSLGMERRDNGYYYLTNQFRINVKDCPEEKILRYRLKCPYVFGDEAVHEFVTYWNIPKKKDLWTYYAICNRMEFEGKVITPISYEYKKNVNISYATIILEK